MPNGPFAHVCLLVFDLDRAIADWRVILEALDPDQLQEPVVRYEDFEGGDDSGMRWATFVAPGGTEIQMIEPNPESPMGRRLAHLGEHVHHLCFTTEDPDAVSRRLAEAGIATSGTMNQDPNMPWQEWTWVLPRSAHGVLVEIAKPYRAVDGQWEPAGGAGPQAGAS